MPAEINVKKLLSTPPASIKRMGKDLFVQTPIYRAKKKYKPVYINKDLFNRLFTPKKDLSFDDMSKIIEAHFNFTIEKERGTGEVIGTAYVDRQADPLNISLSGNGGSGRAYYTGKYFNIKGEKTPLATSDKRRFSDGLLEMERCVWETLVADGLQGSIENGLGPVLAILDMDETCKVVWRDKAVRRGKIIRVDLDGALDRVSHLFYNKTPLKKKALLGMAEKFGLLEADKFIQRIVHGTWSPGNISTLGHLIDFDTVSAVKGRGPQYSSTQWHHENYFGYEQFGQMKILAELAKHKKINAQQVPFDLLRDTMFNARINSIHKQFTALMGFDDSANIYKKYRKNIDTLCDLWIALAQKSYLRHQELSSKHQAAITTHVFDFSQFFRLYPLQKSAGIFSSVDSLHALFNDPFKKPDAAKNKNKIAKEHYDAVMAVIGKDFVMTEVQLPFLKIAALQFIKQYDALHSKISAELRIPLQKAEVAAYRFNEDRRYMFPAYTLSFTLAERQKRPPHESNDMIHALILATRRDPGMIADVRLYEDGYSFLSFDGKGHHQLHMKFFRIKNTRQIIIKRGDTSYICQKNKDSFYVSKKQKNKLLLNSSFSDVISNHLKNMLYP